MKSGETVQPQIKLNSEDQNIEEGCATGNCARPALSADAGVKERLAWWFRGLLTPCSLVRIFAVVILAMAVLSSV